MIMIDIDVTHHNVVIEGRRVDRPAGISVSNWMQFWEGTKKGSYDDGYTKGYSDGEIEAINRFS